MTETPVIFVDPLEPSRIVPFGARMWTVLSGLAAATIAVGAAVVVAVALGVGFGPAEAGAAAGAVVAASLVRFLWVRDDLRPLLANARPVPDRVAVASSPTVSAARVAWERIVDRVYFVALAGLAAYYVETVRGFVLAVVSGLIVGGVLGELGVRRLVADHERRHAVQIYERDDDCPPLEGDDDGEEDDDEDEDDNGDEAVDRGDEDDDGVDYELGPDPLYAVPTR